jgi:hypothetical protein
MAFQTGQVSAGTTATLLCTVGSIPDNSGVLVNASAAAYISGPGVTTSTGFPLAGNSPQKIPNQRSVR